MNKKILFLSAWYPTRYDPMPGLFVKRHAELLTYDFEVAILHTLPVQSLKSKYEIEISTEERLFTVRVYYRKVHNIPGLDSICKFFRFFKAHQKGLKEIRKHYGLPDLTHANILTRVGVYALYLKIRYRIPYVITEHWSRYLPERKEYSGFSRKLITKLIVRQSAAISTVSDKLRKAMQNCHIRHPNFFITYNVVDCDKFRPIALPSSSCKVFAHVSCFDDEAKNVTGIVRAVYELSKKRDDFICLMVGDGNDKMKAEQLADRLNINNKVVRFTGLKEGEELVSLYNQSLFTILFSNYETMSVIIPESFACGKPVIATKVGGIPEIINDSNGSILITPGNEDELMKTINYMLDHYNEFDTNHIRDYVINHFGRKAVLGQLMQLYAPIFSNIR